MDHRTVMDLAGTDAAAYIRKSRLEEGMDTQEVLSKHQKALVEYAAAHQIHLIEIYPEVVSGESLYARPQMLRLLQDVEEGRYDAVLCMDLDRLSRGRMKDQGIILDTFRESDTLIITPEKVYDLSDDIDEEYAELKTFMSRREYKIINKRLQRGLRQSIQAGCYVANAPYGYRKTVVDRKPTLEIYEPEARFVQMMFSLYAQGFGCTSVARQVNALGAKPHRSAEFNRSSVNMILRNPTYIGKIVWDQKKHIRKGARGNPKHITIYQPPEKWTITDGLHPAIVDRELFDRVQAIMAGRYIPSKRDGTVKSPLAGLVKCANCGMNMQRMVMKRYPYLLCTRPGCCASTKFELVEKRVLDSLQDSLDQLSVRKPASGVQDTSPWSSPCWPSRRSWPAPTARKTVSMSCWNWGSMTSPPSGSGWRRSRGRSLLWSARRRRPAAPSTTPKRLTPRPWLSGSEPSWMPTGAATMPSATHSSNP